MSKFTIGPSSLAAAAAAGHVNKAGAIEMEVMDLSEGSRNELAQYDEVIKKMERQKRARTMIVPTAAEDVKARLRQLGHPITLFGEGNYERRERLKEAVAAVEIEGEARASEPRTFQQMQQYHEQLLQQQQQLSLQQQQQQKKKEAIYSNAQPEMVAARQQICEYSFNNAHKRLVARRQCQEDSNLRAAEDGLVGNLYHHHRELVMNSSAAAETRPLVSVRYAPSGNLLATGSLGCSVKLWDTVRLEEQANLRFHEERIMSLAWHPTAGLEADTDAPALLASASADGKCIIWDCRESFQKVIPNRGHSSNGKDDAAMIVDEDAGSSSREQTGGKIVQTLVGHKGAVADCEFHPSGKYVGTAGHDNTWRLWDIETGAELLLQDGHIKECSTLAFQGDGALVLTGDAAGVILLWDLRSGQSIHVCQGHVKKISALAFNPNGFQAASSSVDNMIRIWDFRKKKCSHCIPAHSNAISEIRYSKSGELLLSSSFDATLKVWDTREHRLLRTLHGHSGKVMSADFSPDERHIVSAGYDRTLKLWSHRDL